MIPDHDDETLKRQALLVVTIILGYVVLVPLTVGYGASNAPLIGVIPSVLLFIFLLSRRGKNSHRSINKGGRS